MRRLFIIPEKDEPEENIELAKFNNCTEIAKGIPPILKGIISEGDLPLVYEEPEVISETPIEIKDKLIELENRLKAIEDKEIKL